MMQDETGHAPVETIEGANRGMLVLCDHASSFVPPEYDALGLPDAAFARHIAYDVGAAGLTRALAAEFSCPAVLTRYSRLLIDPNRGEDDPTLVMKLSDGAIIPGNRHADRTEVERRLDRFYRPYDAAIRECLDDAPASGPAVVAVHSFTPQLEGRAPRPWHVGVLWHHDARSARRLIDALSGDADLCVGDNAPYRGGMDGECLVRHAIPRGLPHVLIELRNDLIETVEQQAAWGARLAPALRHAFAPDP